MATMICKLNEYDECSEEVEPTHTPNPREYCCDEHANRYRYLKRKERGLLELRKLERREMRAAFAANGAERGTPEQRRTAKDALAAIVATAKPAPTIRRRI